jgi:hypothetical protein
VLPFKVVVDVSAASSHAESPAIVFGLNPLGARGLSSLGLIGDM